jgi:hypothetical protein
MPTSYPLYKDSVRNWILNNFSYETRILDIGAGCGTYSDLIRGYGYKLDAVEIWEPYITKYDLKNKYSWVYERNVMNMPFNVLEAYDFYILGDVLEHLSVDDAQWLLSFLRLKGKKFLVAVPYQMFQDEYEGNKYETHLQPDLTPDVMKQRYPELELLYGNEFYGYYINKRQKHEKAYVLYADDSYYDLVDACCRSIRNFSTYPIYVYLLNSDNKVQVENTITIRWDCDVKHLKKRNEYINREDKQIYKLLIERPKIVKHALEKFAEVVAYVDTDSLASPYVDRIFDYFNAESDYPYFTKGIYDFLIINGRGGASSYDDLSNTLEAPVCELFKSDQKERQFTGYRQTGYFIAGQKTIDFLDIWSHRCQHPMILKDNARYAPYNEESVLQTLLYDFKAYNGLPLVYINGLRKGLEFKGYEYFMGEWFKVPAQKDDLLFYHGEKDIDKINEFIEYLKI